MAHTTSFRRVPAGQEPSWHAGVRPNRRVVVRPSALAAAALTAVATLAWLAVAGYGVVRLDALWSVLAAVAAGGVLALALRGFPLVAAAPLLLAVFMWGLATRA